MTKILQTTFGAVILACLFVAQISQADEQPFFVKFTGTVLDLAFDSNGDGIYANVVQAQSKGSFGPSMTTVVSEFEPDYANWGTCPRANDWYMKFSYSTAIVTFENGDQLDLVVDNGSLCVDPETGVFEGGTHAQIKGGTGRFVHATGEGDTSFTGKDFVFTTGPDTVAVERINGVIQGTINLH